MSEISPLELKERLDKGDSIVLLDIRRPYELAIAKLDDSIHIQDSELESRLDEVQKLAGQDKDVVVICRTGTRSLYCVDFLKNSGMERVFNLTGGLHAWSDDVDPSVMKY